MPDSAPHPPSSARQGVYVLRGLLFCSLVVTAGTGRGALHDGFRAALPLLAGLGIGTALAGARTTDRGHRGWALPWIVHLAATWLLTFSPIMWGNREVVRTCALTGLVAVALRQGRRVWQPWILAGALLFMLVTAVSSGPAWLPLDPGDLQYGLGMAWPRGWMEVGRDASLFAFGFWASSGRGIRAVARLRGVARPLGALGRMPLTAALVQGLLAALIGWSGVREGPSPWVRPALVDALLLTQLAFAWWWMRDRPRGPCEHALHMIRSALISVRLGVSRRIQWGVGR